jgi:hypothetical protein
VIPRSATHMATRARMRSSWLPRSSPIAVQAGSCCSSRRTRETGPARRDAGAVRSGTQASCSPAMPSCDRCERSSRPWDASGHHVGVQNSGVPGPEQARDLRSSISSGSVMVGPFLVRSAPDVCRASPLTSSRTQLQSTDEADFLAREVVFVAGSSEPRSGGGGPATSLDGGSSVNLPGQQLTGLGSKVRLPAICDPPYTIGRANPLARPCTTVRPR